MRVSTTNTTTTFQFTPTILNTLPEAEHTDHSDSDENTETASMNMEGGSLTPSPPNPQLELISEEPTTTPPPRRRRPNEDEKTDQNENTNPTTIKEGEEEDDGWVTNQRTPRGGLSPDGGGTHHPPKSVVQAGGARNNYPRSSRAPPSNSTMRTGTGTGKTPSCKKSTNVEQHRRESSRLQNAPKSGDTPKNNSGVDDIIIFLSSSSSSSSCSPHYFRKEQEEIPDSDVTANNICAHIYNNNNNKAYLEAGTKAANTNMDDDSLGLGSAAGGSPLRDGESQQQQPQSREPEGSVPTHRVGQSRRFSDDLSAAIQKELDEEQQHIMNGGTATEATSNGGDTARSTTPSSPLDGLKEISISHITEIYENETDDVSEPSTSPPVGPVTPSQSGLKPRQLLPDEEVEDRVVPLKQPAQPTRRESMEQEAIESSSWNHHHHQPMNDDSFDGGSAPNAPQKSEQSSLRPPSVTDMAPPESDLSVFSIHSGYAMHDPNGNMNGLQPRIVPGTMVQSPAAYSHPYANNIPSHIQPHHQAPLPSLQTQHSIGSNGYSQHPHHYAPSAHHQHHAPAAASYPSVIMAPPQQHHQVGKRKVHFRLVEDIPTPSTLRKHSNLRASFLSFRRNSSRNSLLTPSTQPVDEELPSSSHQEIDRGRVTVSWYEGTTTLELMEHVRNAVIRKVGLQQGTIKLAELRILDESSDPPEEIVLSPYIPSGSRLLLRFTTRDAGGDMTPPHSAYYGRQNSYLGGAPDSPSAAPSPHHSSSLLDLEGLGLNPNQLALLGARLKGLQMPIRDDDDDDDRNNHRDDSRRRDRHRKKSSSPSKTGTPSKKSARMAVDKRSKSDRDRSTDEAILQQAMAAAASTNHPDQNKNEEDEEDAGSSDKDKDSKDDESSVFEMQSLHPDDRIQKSLQNITELLLLERQKAARGVYPKQEKRQVVFTLANYFVLFLSLIAISAEIQARAPEWNAAIERHLNSVKNCSKDQDALFECVSNGDFSGLVASVVLWISRSAATKRIFLFGFDSPRKLWTVVYESLVTAFCWGFSYVFIRRGMNPDTNRNFLQKYWKDAVYGSLAGFNAAFMKHVLKNLIPQEAIEDALQERQLRILSWLPSLSH